MQIVRHECDLEEVEDFRIQALIQQRIEQIEEQDDFDADTFGAFVIAEPGDAIEDLERVSFRPLLGEPPCFESALDHGAFYDLVWALSGDQCATLIVPKMKGVPTGLLALCERYAVPAHASQDADGGST